MSSLVNLERLILRRASLFDTSFQGLFRLESIKLVDCDFKNFKSQSFRHVPNLEQLEFTKPRNFNDRDLSVLRKLNCLRLFGSWEHFESLKHDTLEKLELWFEDVDIFDAKIISGLSNLKFLTLDSISDDPRVIKFINFNYDFLSCLESLELKNLRFSSFDIFSFSKLCNLKKLTLARCLAENKIIRDDFFKGLGQLENLIIMGFDHIFVFDDRENLTHLVLEDNGLNDINSEWFSHIHKLKSLDLSRNMIDQLTKEMFCHLENLKSLDLSQNKLSQLDDGIFAHLENLENLNISCNYEIRELKPKVFDGLEKLIDLDISRLNKDFQLNVDLFQALPNLTSVRIDKRFEAIESELSQKYGSKIRFNFE